ncbi:hypothetical protein [Desulfovibrio sp. UCD-KL4C]|uniref:hypothetical protein n=1 Tax=Desulfovibrio sp. UCD-KL4C TaxID=2578120 RepID=UPI0025BE8097|nr:hypothetical protein [Desulfovibrio sp. UCD-KL4C]
MNLNEAFKNMEEEEKWQFILSTGAEPNIDDWGGLCPHCNNAIKYTVGHYPQKDYPGAVVAKCKECSNDFLIYEDVINPHFLVIHEGADIVTTIRNPDEIAKNDCAHITEQRLFNENLQFCHLADDFFVDLIQGKSANPFLDENQAPLYTCSSCESNLEKIAYSKLKTLFKSGEMDSFLSSLNTFHTKGFLQDADKIILELDTECSCSSRHKVIFFTHMFSYGEFPKYTDFIIANIQGANLIYINGVYSKNDCKSYVDKLFLRWTLIADKIYAQTAYIGNQYKKEDEMKKLLHSLSSYLPAHKTKILTKTSNRTKIKNQLNKEGEIDLNDKYNRQNSGLDKLDNFERTHSKFYAGIVDSDVEIISGSFNYTDGPSTDNLTFSNLPIKIFNKNYLNMLKLDYSPKESKKHYYYKSFGERTFNDGYTIYKKELLDRILNK